jgi:cyclic pyranopterin phosphate synthase
VLYRFDEVDDKLELLPMAARRALDHAGARLSREGWGSLPVAVRKQIVALGGARGVDVDLVREAAQLAHPPPDEMPANYDPAPERMPEDVARALGPNYPVADAVWSSLSPLDRYALAKVASRGRQDRIAAAYGEIVGLTSVSTHLGPEGGARMVDVGEKPATQRRAVSRAEVTMNAEAWEKLRSATVAKGDVIGTARVAGIMAAKRTSELIPMCHTIALSKVTVDFEFDDLSRSVSVIGVAEAIDRTGVEMESLTAVSIAALTMYDMLKGIDRGIVIGQIRLVEKSGGRSSNYSR